MKQTVANSSTNISSENVSIGKVEKKSGKRIGYNYIILRSLKKSPKNDVVTCLYIKSLTNFGICVIKEGTCGDSKDKFGRDIKDRLIWQKHLHESLQDKIRLPRLLGSFEENGNFYLVLERLKGKSLYRVCKEHSDTLRGSLIIGDKTGLVFLEYIIQMLTLLDKLHQQQIIHRDVSSNNFMIMPGDKVAVIDMELSYSLKEQKPMPPFQLGTYGYMSPEQESMQDPAIVQDVFSAAAIILQVWTGGISTTKLTNGPVNLLEERIRFFIPDQSFADIIFQCLQNEPAKRPSLQAVKRVATGYVDDLKARRHRLQNKSIIFNKDEILETLRKGIASFASPLLADEGKGWFSENKKMPANPDKKIINKAWYTSFNNGAAGVIYFLSKASHLNFDIRETKPFIQKGIELIESKYISRIEKLSPSLHFGASGVAVSLASALRDGVIEPQTKYFEWITSLLNIENNKLNLQDGIVGQGMAHWLCQSFLNPQNVNDRLATFVERLLERQENDGTWVRAIKGKHKRVTKGFAKGVAGIAYFLLEYGQRYNDRLTVESAERSLHWLIKKGTLRKNGSIQWRTSTGMNIAPWWTDGAPGIALAFLKAYSVTGNPVYKSFATGALRIHPLKVLDNSLGQDHGLCGLAECYLNAFQTLKEEEWLDRANWIVQVIMHLRKEDSEGRPYWLVDRERQPVTDFMDGNSGILHLLLRFSFQDKIGFPLLPSNWD